MSAVEIAPEMLSAAKVAKLFDVSPLTIRRWVDRGVFPRPIQPTGVKGRRYWPAAAVREFMRGDRPAT